jgi:hypothetical protein
MRHARQTVAVADSVEADKDSARLMRENGSEHVPPDAGGTARCPALDLLYIISCVRVAHVPELASFYLSPPTCVPDRYERCCRPSGMTRCHPMILTAAHARIG